MSPFDLMNFLIKRFSLTSQDVEEYTDYIVNAWHSSSNDVNTATTISSSASSEHSTTTLHELFNDKSHIIGPQVFFMIQVYIIFSFTSSLFISTSFTLFMLIF